MQKLPKLPRFLFFAPIKNKTSLPYGFSSHKIQPTKTFVCWIVYSEMMKPKGNSSIPCLENQRGARGTNRMTPRDSQLACGRWTLNAVTTVDWGTRTVEVNDSLFRQRWMDVVRMSNHVQEHFQDCERQRVSLYRVLLCCDNYCHELTNAFHRPSPPAQTVSIAVVVRQRCFGRS